MTMLVAALTGAFVALSLSAALAAFVIGRRRIDATAAASSVEPVPSADVETPCDAEMRERVDREAFDALRVAGAERDGPTDLHFFLRFPDQRAAESAASQVVSLSVDASRLGVQLDRLPFDGGWLCLVTAHAMPSEAVIRTACGSLRGVALECGGELDGWGLATLR